LDFEKRVDKAIREMIQNSYEPKVFINMRIQHGTIEAIKRLIHSTKIPQGFTTLWEMKRLDLSMENIIQETEWHNLFSDEDRQAAKKRLIQYEYIG
jgi:hypothetical protein